MARQASYIAIAGTKAFESGESVMRVLAIAVVLVLAATVATYVRYQSLSPCDWMEQDMADESDLPRVVIQARIAASFLLDGITDPTPVECLNAWWRYRVDGLPEES